MISYRPVPELTAGRKGFRAAIGAMALAAVLGTTAFATADAGPDTVAESRIVAVVNAAAVLPAEQLTVRRQDTGGSLEQGSAAGPLSV